VSASTDLLTSVRESLISTDRGIACVVLFSIHKENTSICKLASKDRSRVPYLLRYVAGIHVNVCVIVHSYNTIFNNQQTTNRD